MFLPVSSFDTLAQTQSVHTPECSSTAIAPWSPYGNTGRFWSPGIWLEEYRLLGTHSSSRGSGHLFYNIWLDNGHSHRHNRLNSGFCYLARRSQLIGNPPSSETLRHFVPAALELDSSVWVGISVPGKKIFTAWQSTFPVGPSGDSWYRDTANFR